MMMIDDRVKKQAEDVFFEKEGFAVAVVLWLFAR
jgi:hypothetical protein